MHSESLSPRVKTANRHHRGASNKADPTQPAQKRQKTSPSATAEAPDPCAASFLCDALGPDKYALFSARLFERRLSAAAKARASPENASPGEADDRNGNAASVLDFLVKVEVVKEVLRKYVPHPYNPIKSQTHEYSGAPSGRVTLTRTTVLSLSGWSNTQFAYVSRRSEGISVLRKYDATLAAVASALDHRLSGTPSPSAEQLAVVDRITGKSLDKRITEVAKTHNVSPFLRGRHCSLDAFGAGGMGVVADVAPSVAPPVSAAPRSVPLPLALPTRLPPPPPPSLFAFASGTLVSKLSYSISDSRSSGKRQRGRRRDDDASGTSSDEGDDQPATQKRARLLSDYLALM